MKSIEQRPLSNTGTLIYYSIEPCSLGLMLVAQSERGVCSIQFGDDRQALVDELRQRFRDTSLVEDPDRLQDVSGRIAQQVDDPFSPVEVSLDIRGTNFQQEVWYMLKQIPTGVTMSYTEVAKKMGRPKSARAVAQACAANKLAVVVPCHRVLRSDGTLSGYRWGVERKRVLLEKEKAL